MTARTAPKDTLSSMLLSRWERAGEKLAALAEALPEESYEFGPAEGLRTPGDVLRHVAFWNRYVTAVVRGIDFDDSPNELPKAEYGTKTKIVDALRSSAAGAAAALNEHAAGLEPKTTKLVVTFLEHTSEQYGQLVVYARLNGIIPPASLA